MRRVAGLARGFGNGIRRFAERSAESLSESWRDAEMAELLDAFAPLVVRGREQLRKGVQELWQTWPELPFDPATIEELLLQNLPSHLQRILGRTMALELNVARLLGVLEGDTPEEALQQFRPPPA